MDNSSPKTPITPPYEFMADAAIAYAKIADMMEADALNQVNALFDILSKPSPNS